MASTAVALQDLPATDAKLVRLIVAAICIAFPPKTEHAVYPFKHLMLDAVEC